MESRAQRRAQLIPAVARSVRGRDFRAEFAQADCTTQRIVVCLPDDPMEYVFKQLDEHGHGVVVLPCDDHMKVAIFTPASAARLAVAEEDDALARVHGDADVTMLFCYLEQTSGPAVIQKTSAKLLRDAPRVCC